MPSATTSSTSAFWCTAGTKEDTFYRGLLGFKPYWFGGMQDNKIDWVSQQVPDGHDWLEYMLTSGPSGTGIPATMSQQQLGVLDHLSIGENSVDDGLQDAQDARTGWTACATTGTPRSARTARASSTCMIPTGFGLELMNFHATEKPCCSPFTAQDPAE